MLEWVLLSRASRALRLRNTGIPTYINSDTDVSCHRHFLIQSLLFAICKMESGSKPLSSHHVPIVHEFCDSLCTIRTGSPGWKLQEGDWNLFTKEANLLMSSFKLLHVEEVGSITADSIINAACLSVPETKCTLPKHPTPWLASDSETACSKQNQR